MSDELLVVVVVLCHSRVLGLSSSIILRTNNRSSHPVLLVKHTKDQSIPIFTGAGVAARRVMELCRRSCAGRHCWGQVRFRVLVGY